MVRFLLERFGEKHILSTFVEQNPFTTYSPTQKVIFKTSLPVMLIILLKFVITSLMLIRPTIIIRKSFVPTDKSRSHQCTGCDDRILTVFANNKQLRPRV